MPTPHYYSHPLHSQFPGQVQLKLTRKLPGRQPCPSLESLDLDAAVIYLRTPQVQALPPQRRQGLLEPLLSREGRPAAGARAF